MYIVVVLLLLVLAVGLWFAVARRRFGHIVVCASTMVLVLFLLYLLEVARGRAIYRARELYQQHKTVKSRMFCKLASSSFLSSLLCVRASGAP